MYSYIIILYMSGVLGIFSRREDIFLNERRIYFIYINVYIICELGTDSVLYILLCDIVTKRKRVKLNKIEKIKLIEVAFNRHLLQDYSMCAVVGLRGLKISVMSGASSFYCVYALQWMTWGYPQNIWSQWASCKTPPGTFAFRIIAKINIVA